MGDWATTTAGMEQTEAAVVAQAEALKKEADATIAMLRNVHSAAAANLIDNVKLEAKLKVEEQNAEDTRVALKTATDEIAILRQQIAQMDSTVKELESQVNEVGGELQRQVAEKETEVSSLQDRLSDQVAMMKGLKHMSGSIDSFHVGEGVLREPNAAVMLPDGCVVVTDHYEGLFKFSNYTQLIGHTKSSDWKWPQGLAYNPTMKRLLVTLAHRVGPGDERFERAVGVFTLGLELERTIPGPAPAAADHAAKERLAVTGTGDLYLTLADACGSALYKHAAGKWAMVEVTTRPGSFFADVAVLHETGPITEVLVTETRMGYIHKFAIGDNDICYKRSVAVVEKPGAIAVDEDGTLFCQDLKTGQIRIVDTLRWEGVGDVGVIDEALFAITASNGYLGAAGRESRLVRVFRYKKDALKLQGD